MSGHEIQHFKPKGGAVKEAILVQDRYFTTRYAVAPSGAVYADVLTSRPGADVAGLMQQDLDHMEVGERGFFHVQRLDLEPILAGKKEVPEDVQAFFARHVPKVLIDVARVPSDVRFNDILNFHLQGDREARLQIVRALPAMRRDFYRAKGNSTLLQLVDGRKSPVGELCRIHDIDEAEFRTVRRIQAIQSKAIADGSSEAWNMIPHSAVQAIPLILTSDHELRDIGDVACVARALQVHSFGAYGPVPQALIARAFRGAAVTKWPQIIETIRAIPRTATDFTTMIGIALEGAITTAIARRHAPESLAACEEIIPRVVGGESLDGLSDSCAEAAERYCDALLAAGRQRSALQSACKKIVAEHFSLKRFREFSDRWHHQQAAMREAAMSVKADLNWDPLVGSVALGALSARELCSNRELEKQGRVQNNCVGGYTDVLIGSNKAKVELIFALEDDTAVHSTIRVVASRQHGRKGYDWYIGEHAAHSNNAPSAVARKSAADLLEHLGALPADSIAAYGQRMARTEGLPSKIAKAMENSRGNVFDARAPEKLLGAYASVLPRQLRSWTADDWTCAVSESGGDVEIKRIQTRFDELEKRILEMKQEEHHHEPQS